jgi:hypothetical protein
MTRDSLINKIRMAVIANFHVYNKATLSSSNRLEEDPDCARIIFFKMIEEKFNTIEACAVGISMGFTSDDVIGFIGRYVDMMKIRVEVLSEDRTFFRYRNKVKLVENYLKLS